MEIVPLADPDCDSVIESESDAVRLPDEVALVDGDSVLVEVSLRLCC
jgi:hypothetical protein